MGERKSLGRSGFEGDIVHPDVVGKVGRRANLVDDLRVWKPAIQQTWKSAVQTIHQQFRDAPMGKAL
jgi:hypothetical protein